MRRLEMLARLLATALCAGFVEVSLCVPAASTQVQPSGANSTPTIRPAAFPPIVNTTAFSTNGTTSQPLKVETKVYIPPTQTSNLTHRQVFGERRILGCESKTATFHHSHCKYRNDRAASIRKWITWCREPIPEGAPQPTFTLPSEARAMASSLATHDTSLWAEYGECEDDEVCLDSLYSVNHRDGMILIANCVKKKFFVDAGQWKPEWDDDQSPDGESVNSEFADAEQEFGASGSSSGLDVSESDKGDEAELPSVCKTQKPTGGGAEGGNECPPQQQQAGASGSPSLFAGRYASVVMSKDESGDTPVEVEELGLRSIAANSSANGENFGGKAQNSLGVAEQERKCTDCMKLKTIKPFTPDTEALEMEVKMVSAGSAALAGVLWVALLSG